MIDNNPTRKLSTADPVQIAAIKGLVAGSVNLGFALWQGARVPALSAISGAGVVRFFGYGVSLVLFVLALPHLGTAGTGMRRTIHRASRTPTFTITPPCATSNRTIPICTIVMRQSPKPRGPASLQIRSTRHSSATSGRIQRPSTWAN